MHHLSRLVPLTRLPRLLCPGRAARVALLAGSALLGLPAVAESLASSAASTASSAVGSLSNSLTQSSNSSSKTNNVAEGDYRIIDRATVAERPGTVRLTLQPLQGGADAGFALWLPEPVAQQAGLVAGGTVTARQRPYGVEFAQGEPRQAFFLVLADDWYRELQTTAVAL